MKRMVLFGVLAVGMLFTISFVSAIDSSSDNLEKKESPLFKIRIRQSIGQRIGEIISHLKLRFLQERIFFIPSEPLFDDDFFPSIPLCPCKTYCTHYSYS